MQILKTTFRWSGKTQDEMQTMTKLLTIIVYDITLTKWMGKKDSDLSNK